MGWFIIGFNRSYHMNRKRLVMTSVCSMYIYIYNYIYRYMYIQICIHRYVYMKRHAWPHLEKTWHPNLISQWFKVADHWCSSQPIWRPSNQIAPTSVAPWGEWWGCLEIPAHNWGGSWKHMWYHGIIISNRDMCNDIRYIDIYIYI